jgi:hypothetical protein
MECRVRHVLAPTARAGVLVAKAMASDAVRDEVQALAGDEVQALAEDEVRWQLQ